MQNQISRTLQLATNCSLFLFGPRMTGKTTILNTRPCNLFIDHLDPDEEFKYKAFPLKFQEEIEILPDGSTIVIDEIQRVPALLNVVQRMIDKRGFHFILSGSSSRKLKRGGANLLGGRALEYHLHPFTHIELGKLFNLEEVLSTGSLPKIALWKNEPGNPTKNDWLKTYLNTYLKEEIQTEALTRNLGAFQRFLKIAGYSNGQIIEFSNVSRECAVPSSTVKEYFQILEDTLIGNFLWTWDRSERKKARPKFFFFDTGVVRALQSRLTDPPTPAERGILFETFIVNELRSFRDYERKEDEFTYWRNRSHEIDILITRGNKILLGVECKTGSGEISKETAHAFRNEFPGVPLLVVNDSNRGALKNDIKYLPWRDFFEYYRKM